MKFGLGQPLTRVEDVRLLTGAGAYVDDIPLDGQLHAAVLRSPIAHGRITELDVSAARAASGVRLIWTFEEIAGRLRPLSNDFPLEPAPVAISMPHLADERVRFVGQPVAFVVAETRAQAEDAAELIVLDFEEAQPLVEPAHALQEGAPQLHDDAPGNLAYSWECGDRATTEALFRDATHVVQTHVVNQRIVVSSMEPRAINIRYLSDTERWEAWVSSQGAHGIRAKISRAIGVEPERVRVHVPDVGGGFGMKLMDHPEYGLCALAARELGRPVKWIGTRSESFLSDAQGRDMRATVEGAFDADGRCRAMRMESISGLGAYYSTFGAGVHTVFSAPLLGGMYGLEAIHCSVRGAFTNTPSTDAYRGAGRPETIHATERLMDAAARQLGIDRAEIRRRNLVTPPMLPHATPGGFTFDSLDTHLVLDRALAAADYAGFEARADDAAARGAYAGIGIAYYMERTGGSPVENARLTIDADGGLSIWVGTQSSGQGHETAWAQIAHEALGLPFDRIRLMPGDSDMLEAGGGTGGSRSLIMASRVLLLSADDIIAQGRVLAANKLEAAEDDIEYDAAAGALFRIAGTDRTVGLATLAAEAGGITGTGNVGDRESTFPNGCHIAEVEIDGDTGWLTLKRYTVIDDFGRMVNPSLVLGQVHGGVVQGLGQVMGEAAIWDADTGQPLTGSYMDYRMPRADDLPFFEVAFEEVPCKTNPLGVKGCGEAGSVGGIPSGALAVLDALARAGAEGVETPHTPLRLWQSLAAREAAFEDRPAAAAATG